MKTIQLLILLACVSAHGQTNEIPIQTNKISHPSDGYNIYDQYPDGKMIVNESESKKFRDGIASVEQHQRDLTSALQTRVLTDDEMREVLRSGKNLFTFNMRSYREEDVQREFNEAILQQQRLRLLLKPDSQNQHGFEHPITNLVVETYPAHMEPDGEAMSKIVPLALFIGKWVHDSSPTNVEFTTNYTGTIQVGTNFWTMKELTKMVKPAAPP